MALPALIVAAIARIRAANNNAYDAVNNPAGLGQGGQRQNFIPDINAVADIGMFAGECVDKADADVVLTHADVQLTHQDASNTALDRIATAQSVLDAAGKVVLAGAEADRAKAQADLAKGYAAGVKLPVIDASMVGRFLKVGVDASGNAVYELGEITIATAAQINAGTGTGFANAQTLGPILKGIRDSADVAASKLPPVGSYILWPFYAKSDPGPGPNWIEPKGQIVPLSSYPKLADVLPVYPVAAGRGNPGYTPSGTIATGGNVQGLALEGSRFVAMVTGALVYSDTATGKAFVSTGGFTSLPYDRHGSYGLPGRPLLRDNDEVLFFEGSSSYVQSINLSSKAAADFGAASSAVMQNDRGDSSSYQGMYKLPNGTVVAINQAANNNYGTFYRFWRLPAGAAVSNGFQTFDPIASGSMGQFNPTSVRHWQTKNGTLYVACRPRGSTAAHTIYRTTDGSSWTVVGSFNFQNVSAYTVDDQTSARPSQGRRPLNNLEESPDGQQIIVSVNYGYLVSVNGGASWAFRTRSQLVSMAAPYSMLTGQSDSVNWLSFTWDKFRSQWVFFALVNKAGFSNNVLMILAGSSLNLLSVIGDTSVSVNANSGSVTHTAIHVTANRIYIWFTTSGSLYWAFSFPYAAIPGSANALGSQAGLKFVARLEGLPFDGAVFESESTFQAWWLPNDDSPIIEPSDSVSSSYANTDFNVSPDKTRVVNVYYPGSYQVWQGAPFEYNPALERKLPNVSLPNISGQFPFTEQVRNKPTSPRVLMRVN